MRYHFVKPQLYNPRYGIIYECNHEVYSKCTLYLIKDKGLAVIQQRYDKETKTTFVADLTVFVICIIALLNFTIPYLVAEYQLLIILQRTIDIFEVDVNAYEPYVKDINREIELIKKWRQKDNQIKTHLKG